MTSPIFIDTNVPMYASGRPHPLKEGCGQVLRLAAREPALFVTDAEVLQEIMHRYRAQNDWRRGREVFDGFLRLMQGRIEPIGAIDVERAAALADEHGGLSARDLLHLAVMGRVRTTSLVSTDRGFDHVPGIRRLDPAGDWVHDVHAGRDGT